LFSIAIAEASQVVQARRSSLAQASRPIHEHCNADDVVTWGRDMIVLGLSATLIVASTLAALMLLLGIDIERHAAAERLF